MTNKIKIRLISAGMMMPFPMFLIYEAINEYGIWMLLKISGLVFIAVLAIVGLGLLFSTFSD